MARLSSKYRHRSSSPHDHHVINGVGERMHREQENDRSTCRLSVHEAQSVVRAPRMDDEEQPRSRAFGWKVPLLHSLVELLQQAATSSL